MQDILQAVAEGSLSPEDAEKRLGLFAVTELEGLANLDASRSRRLGAAGDHPLRGEVVGAGGGDGGVAIGDRGPRDPLRRDLGPRGGDQAPRAHGATVEFDEQAELIVWRKPGLGPKPSTGSVAVVTAGTSDIPVARQVQVIAEALGASSELYPDVGISGLHRLFPVVRAIVETEPDVVVVVAGQEGGLAPVLAGLIDVPIVGVPTSTGTGLGGQGIGALTTMLQACSMGIAVVNIDNGVAAGTIAASIARRAHRRAAGR